MNRNAFPTGVAAVKPDTKNDAGGAAFALTPKEALAQYALTGCFNATFYATEEQQVERATELLAKVNEPMFVARLALYARRDGLMKDMPVFLLAWLARNDVQGDGFRGAFDGVVDHFKQLSNLVRVLRSGAWGKKTLSSRIRARITKWLDAHSAEDLWYQSVGVADPSLADVVRLVHPKPFTPAHGALYGHLSGRNPAEKAPDRGLLPAGLRAFEAKTITAETRVPFQMLTSTELDKDGWKAIAMKATWQQARQSLNTFKRHGLFQDKDVVGRLAALLGDPAQVAKSRVMPYQLLTTYQHIEEDTPRPIVNALHEAVGHACAKVPKLSGKVLVAVDISGSMRTAVTGARKGATSKTTCIDAAALIASALLRTNQDVRVIAFCDRIDFPKLEPLDSVFTNAKKLTDLPGGGTNCSLVMQWAETILAPFDIIIYVSDNESWSDSPGSGLGARWAAYARKNPKSKLVCIDLTPNTTAQFKPKPDERRFYIGGFSDNVFNLLAMIASDSLGSGLVGRIEATTL